MKRCRELCTEYGALLVLDDEVMIGFRVALAARRVQEHPRLRSSDITVLGKVIMAHAAAAFGGPTRHHMEHPVLPWRTRRAPLSGNPVLRLAVRPRCARSAASVDAGRPPPRSLVDGLAQGRWAKACPSRRLRRRYVWLLPAARAPLEPILLPCAQTDSAFNQFVPFSFDRGVVHRPGTA